MGLEAGNFLNDLVVINPVAGDPRNQGDDHLRLIKEVLKNTFPGFTGQFTRTQTKSAGYTPVLNDNWSAILATASLTLGLTAAATLGNGWALIIIADGGDVTVDPNSTEEINGAATSVVVEDGNMALLVCTGAEFYLLQAPRTIPVIEAFPIGSIFMSVVATAPATLLGYGTWVAFGTGRMPIGIDSGNALFDTAEETGGSADIPVVAHDHTFTTGGQSADHSHVIGVGSVGGTSGGVSSGVGVSGGANTNATSNDHTHSGTTASTGVTGTNKNYPPFIAVYMWKRTG